MIYVLEGDKLEEQSREKRKEVEFRPCLAIMSGEELTEEQGYLQLPSYFLSELFTGQSCRLESHDGFDFISLSMPDWGNLAGKNRRIAVYYRVNLLVFACEGEAGKQMLSRMIESISERGIRSLSLEHILYEFFDQLTDGDSQRLEEIEQEIFTMEEALADEVTGDYIRKTVDLRRRLLILKRYYEQLLDIAEAIEDNQNELFSTKIVKAFHILTNRTDRLMDSVLNLRDYVSQVREAYQSQVDIRQNDIMRLFTVITAVFLPLTLIVGWYGMNLRMPEFHMAFAYPAVIAVSIAVAAGSLYYFKKKKWF